MGEYLRAIRDHYTTPTCTVLPTISLEESIEIALEAHVHRIWIVESIVKHSRKVVGVLSYTDMIRLLN
jgi:hypothetical protein